MLFNLLFEFALWATSVLVALHHHIMDVLVSSQECSRVNYIYKNMSKQI